MKTIWFHLMPYPALPEDFTQQHRSVWVDIDPDLFDPAVAHVAYNDYIDELEHAAACGFDGVGVNEHHANAYGLMPSPNIVAAALARTCPDAAIVLLGNSVALYNPPLRVAEEMAMLDCITGGRLVAGFPVGTPMDTTFAYGQNPATLRERYHEGIELILRAWTERRGLRVQRPPPQAALRQLLAASHPAAAPAGVDPRRWLDRHMGVVRARRACVPLPLVLRVQGGAADDEGVLGAGATKPGGSRTRSRPGSRSSSRSPTRRPRPASSTAAPHIRGRGLII